MRIYLSIAIFTFSIGFQSGQLSANTIFGDSFNASFNGVGGASGTADPSTRFDINTSLNGQNIEVNWVDDDSFDFAFFGGGGGNDISYTLSDLDFQNASGTRYKIIGAIFNMNDSNVQGFFDSPSNPGGVPASEFIAPTLSFTDNSVTAFFPTFNDQLAGDGPRLRYDLQLAPVPLPAPILLMASGIAALAGFRKKRSVSI